MNKKLIVIFLALLVLGMSVAVAADADDSTSTTKKVTKDTTKIVKNTAVTKKAIKAVDTKTTSKAKETTKTVENKTEQNTKTVTKKTGLKNVKTEVPITDSNFDIYFKSTGFESNVQDGETFTFTGNITRNTSIIIDKPVNIITYDDSVLSLNTTSGSYMGNETGNAFSIVNTGSYTNITNLKFYNTQIFVKNAHHVTMDNINVTVNNQRIGSGVGVTSIRENSSYITVKNSYFHTFNNDNSSSLVLAWADYCTIDNNTIIGEENVGNLMYLTTYNIPGVNYTNVSINTFNNITNNRIYSINLNGPCVGVVVSGHNNTFEGNNVSVPSAFAGQWISPTATLVGDFNDTYEGNLYINNDVNGSFTGTKNSTICENIFHGSVSLPERCIFCNNNAENSTVTVTGKDCILCNNTIYKLVVKKAATNTRVCSDNVITITADTYGNIVDVNHPSLTLNKKLTRSVKSDGEPTIINIDDDASLSNYFIIDEDEGIKTMALLANKITTDTIINLAYVPSDVTMFQISINKPDFSISVVGQNDLTLENVNMYLQHPKFSLSNMTLKYTDKFDFPYAVQLSNKVVRDDNSFVVDNVTFDYVADLNDGKTALINFGSISDNSKSNITIKNSVINANMPSSSDNDDVARLVEIRTDNVKFIKNVVNIEESYVDGETPKLVAFYENANRNNWIFDYNNITITGKGDLHTITSGGNGHTITNNQITVTSESTAKAIEFTGNDNTVTGNVLVANDLMGDDAVVATGENNVIQGNGPMGTELTVINPSVVNVNEISPMTVILKDAKGNLLANQEINVTVGDESETISTDASGIAVYEFLPTTSGSVDIVFNYLGGGMFLSSNKTVTVTVNEDKDAIIEELNKTIQEQNETIASQEEDIEDLNKIIEEQDNEIESLTNTTQALNNTVAQLEQDLTHVQEQLANNNNSNTNGTSNTNTTTPTKTSVTLKVNPTTIYTGSKTKITATLKDANGKAVASQKISIKVGTKTYTVKTNKKGVATKTLKVTKTGKNKVTATFKATKKYAKATKTTTLTVKAKEKTKITISKLSYKNKKITIKATIKAGKKALTQNTKLTIKVDGKTLTSKKISKKGKISLTLSKALKNGSHKVQIISKATSMYKQAKVSKNLKV